MTGEQTDSSTDAPVDSDDQKDAMPSHFTRGVTDETAQEERMRRALGIKDDMELNRATIANQLAHNYTEVRESKEGLRPHFQPSIDAATFREHLEASVDGELRDIGLDNGVVHLAPELDHGIVSLSISLDPLAEEISEEYKHLQPELSTMTLPSYYTSRSHHTTLLRDVSTECAEVVDTIHQVVDGFDGVYWGGEPVYIGKSELYDFSTSLYIR